MTYPGPSNGAGTRCGAAMTRTIWTKAGLFAVSAQITVLGLAACATPTYPTKAGYTPPAPIRPQYPASARSAPARSPIADPALAAASPAPEASAAAPAPAPQTPLSQVVES